MGGRAYSVSITQYTLKKGTPGVAPKLLTNQLLFGVYVSGAHYSIRPAANYCHNVGATSLSNLTSA